MYTFIYMKILSASHRADEGKGNLSWSQLGIPLDSTAAGSKEEQTDYVKDGIAKQTLP